MTYRDEPVLSAREVRRAVGRGADTFEVVIETLDLPASARVAIVGPSGSGKSTALALLALAMRPDAAGILVFHRLGSPPVDARALWLANRYDSLAGLRARMLGFVPQVGGLLPFLTLRANIALTQKLAGQAAPERISRLVEALEIAHALDRLPGEVSVGQRQRAAVARALAHAPPIVLADEPTAAVHPAQARTIMTLLADGAALGGAALLVATHDICLAESAGLAIAPIRAGGVCSSVGWIPE
jgi:putative ABC transport system ATP-binding protein